MAVEAVPNPAVAADHTSTGLNHRKILMWTFLGSECMFFASLISNFQVQRGRSLNGPYPDDVINIPFTSISTFALLMSSLMMVLALAAIQRNDVRGLKIWLLACAFLGTLFLGGQFFEFTQFVAEKGLKLSTNLFGASFFVLTGFHGTHVTIGVIWLISLYFAAARGRITVKDSLSVELAGLYWHFVDIVWVAIFTIVYLLKV
ncbi:MAG TPA: heme-copper oxidase subunit III [Chloroflexota bacterium]|jgi:heme/copper-type cytochrome/quinol oxidase subunit 3|nr:heme-copper oxidase subunit III [Chloroflexota bacterium]